MLNERWRPIPSQRLERPSVAPWPVHGFASAQRDGIPPLTRACGANPRIQNADATKPLVRD